MPETLDYNRPKASLVNDTPIDFKLLFGELPNSPGAVPVPGLTSDLDCYLECDVSGVGNWQPIFRIETLQELVSTGIMKITVTITPIKGNGTLGTPIITVFIHDQNMDNYQTQAGFPRV